MISDDTGKRNCLLRYVNAIFLCSVFAVSVYNGASFYIGKIYLNCSILLVIPCVPEVFSRQYIKSLELLQGWENSGVDKSSSSTHQSSKAESHEIDEQSKKQS